MKMNSILYQLHLGIKQAATGILFKRRKEKGVSVRFHESIRSRQTTLRVTSSNRVSVCGGIAVGRRG